MDLILEALFYFVSYSPRLAWVYLILCFQLGFNVCLNYVMGFSV
jgi:hypothetical protein